MKATKFHFFASGTALLDFFRPLLMKSRGLAFVLLNVYESLHALRVFSGG